MPVQISVLTENDKKQIHGYTIKLLAETGIEIGKPEIRSLLLQNGGKAAGGDRVQFNESMIQDALAKVPKSFSLFGCDGKEYPLGGGVRPLVSTCMVDPLINTPEGNRLPVLEDCARAARIIQHEPLIDCPYKMDLKYTDIPEEDSVAQSNFAVFSNMTKPFVAGPQTKRDIEIILKMAQVMAAGRLSEKPNVITLISPSSPLALHRDCLEMLETVLAYGAPVICLPCPMNGLTSPVSVAGTVLTVNAENLALLTVIQLLRPNSKAVYHTVAMPADARTLEARMTGPEKMLDTMASAEMGRWYGLPVGLPVSSTDVSAFDIQNGGESMSQIFPGALFAPDIFTGIGSNTNACGTSAEQILLDCEMLTLAMRFARGMDCSRLQKGFETLTRVGPGGSFLDDADTLADFLEEDVYFPELFSWTGHKDASKSALQKAQEKAARLAEKPVVVDNHKLQKLSELMKTL